jgi:hypothetical protein
MREFVIMLVLSITYLVWGFYIVLFPEKFRKNIEKSSKNGIRILGLTVAGVSIISFMWIYIMFLVGNLMEELFR